MPDKIYHSEKLDLDYKIKYNSQGNKVVVFKDNVNYSSYEMQKLKGFSDGVLRQIHNIKNIFEGVIV